MTETTKQDRLAAIEAKLRRIAEQRAQGLLKPEDADAQRAGLERQLFEAVMPDAPPPRPPARTRLAAAGAMLGLVAAVSAWLWWGYAGLNFKTVEMLRESARQDRERAAASLVPSGSASSAPVVVPADAWVAGVVRADASLAARAARADAVFITLRHPGDDGLPLAVVRKRADDLPVAFAILPADALGDPSRVTGDARPLVLEVRVSASGRGLPEKGDLEGGPVPVRLGARDVALVVGRVRGE